MAAYTWGDVLSVDGTMFPATLADTMKKSCNIYLDHAATTPLDVRVQEAMLPFFTKHHGNPGSFHSIGKAAKDAVDAARAVVAAHIEARPDEMVFTGSGTESDNLAILGYARANAKHGKHVVTTSIEHHAVLEPMQFLQKYEGFELTIVPVQTDGVVRVEDVLAAVRPDTILVSVMMANNEIGTIQPVADIGREVVRMREDGRAPHLAFHTDAAQAMAYLPVDVRALHVDLLSFNGSKIYGPKGVGALYVKRGVRLQPLQFGGSQERALRPGTEHVAGIVGLAEALFIVREQGADDAARLQPLRDRLIDGLLERVPKSRLNGSRTERLPNNVNISFMDIEGEALILYLDAEGIFVSTGSACTSASLDPSHVILALGMPYEVAHGSVRFTLGRGTTEQDIDAVLEVLPHLVEKLRAISPVRVDEKFWKTN